MKIALVQPHAGEARPDYIHEPLGLGYLASYLLRAAPADSMSIEVALFAGSDSDILNRIDDSDVVGFTATSPMVGHAARLIKQLKERRAKLPVVFGGAHGTADPESLLRPGLADFVVRGEGEETFLELVRALEDHGPVESIAGLSYRSRDGAVRHNPGRPLIRDIDTIPLPARRLMAQDKFLDWGQRRYGDRGAWVFSSRGCPYNCTYCASHELWSRLWRPRRAEEVVAEIRDLVETFGVDRINFADDTFSVSARRLEQFCRLMEAEKLPVVWACNVRVDTVDRDAYPLMRRAGCVEVWLGVESGSERILKEMKKGIDLQQVRNAFRWAREAGLSRRAYFMVGSPGDTAETIAESEALIEDIEPNKLLFSVFTPYPGCEAHERAVEEGFALSDIDWEKVDGLRKPIIPGRFMSREEIEAEFARLRDKYDPIWG